MSSLTGRVFHSALFALLVACSISASGQDTETRSQIIALFRQATEADQAHDSSRASILYRRIAALDPKIAEVWSNLGMSLYQQGKYEEAITAFRRATALKAELLVPHLFMGLAYSKRGEPARAIEPLKAALTIQSDQPEATLALADAYAQTHQFNASVRLLKAALQEHPDSEDFSSNLAVTWLDWATDIGNALRRAPGIYGRLLTDRVRAADGGASAEAAFRATADDFPDSVDAHLALANFLIEHRPGAEQLRVIREQIDAARNISSEDPEVAVAGVHAAIAQNDVPAAISALQSIAQYDPAFTLANLDALAAGLPSDAVHRISDEAQTLAATSGGRPGSYSATFQSLQRIRSARPLTSAEASAYAAAAWHLHRYDAAFAELSTRHLPDAASQYWLFRTCEALGRTTLEQTVAGHPDSVRSHLLMADFAIQRDEFGAAESEYDKALRLRPDDPEILLLHVRLLETEQKTGDALKEAARGSERFPSSAGLNFEAGELTLRSSGDPASATKYLQQALQIDPHLLRARVDLADALARMNQYSEAIQQINSIVGTDDDGSLHYRLALWYRQTGQVTQSENAMAICRVMKERQFRKDVSLSR